MARGASGGGVAERNGAAGFCSARLGEEREGILE